MSPDRDTPDQSMPHEPDAPDGQSMWKRAPLLARLLIIFAGVFVGLIILGIVALQLINTDPGRAWVARQVSNIAPESGLRVSVGEIDGSLFSRMTIRDLEVSDPKGVFLTSPAVEVDWEPLAFARNQLRLNSVTADIIRLIRLPELLPTEQTEGPLLPSFDIYLGRLAIDQLVLEEGVAGTRQVLAVQGRTDIRSGRALVDLTATSVSGGDRILVKLDAEPDANKLDINASVTAPADGAVAGLLGLDRALAIQLEGAGSWADWSGRLSGTAGENSLADLKIGLQSGRFAVDGTVSPAPFLTGTSARLVSPAVDVKVDGAVADQILNATFALGSPAFRVNGDTALDLGTSQFSRLHVEGELLRPGDLLENLSARGLRLTLNATGAMSAPDADVALVADRIAVGETGIEELDFRATVRMAEDPKTINIVATAPRVTGVPEVAGDILRNVRVEGPLLLKGSTIESDAIKITSDKLNVRALVSIDPAAGRYNVLLNGRLSRFEVPGMGVVDVDTNVRAIPAPGGTGTQITGSVDARFRRLDNETIRTIAGGLPRLRADVSASSAGAVTLRNAQITGPDMRITGSGTRGANGALSFTFTGRTEAYGPLDLRVSGSQEKPDVLLRLASPGLGIGLAEFTAHVEPATGGWALSADGASNYGPVSARAVALTGREPLTINLLSAQALGLTARGTIQQSGEAYAGRIGIAGSGLNGVVALRPEGSVQRIDANMTADQARLPLNPDLRIGGGTIAATVRLLDAGPAATARVALNNVKRGSFALTTVNGAVNYNAGSGRATLALVGTEPAEFTLNSTAVLAPEKITIAANGTLLDDRFQLATPAQLVSGKDGWRLLPTTLRLPEGNVQMSGQFGSATSIDAKLNGVGLGTLNLIYPDLGVRGSASGQVNMSLPASGGLPQVEATLNIRDLAREGLALSSLPIDIDLAAALKGDTGATRAIIRREGKVIGQMQAELSPIPGTPSDSMTERLLSSPVRGTVRYRGPAEALFPLSGVEALDVRGPIAIRADINGNAGQPNISGLLRARDARIEAAASGTVLRNVEIDSRFSGSQLQLVKLSARTAGDGSLTGAGTVNLSLAQGLPINLRFQLDSARVLDRDDLKAVVSGPLTVTHGKGGGLITGQLEIEDAQVQVGSAAAATIPTIDVRDAGVPPENEGAEQIEEDTSLGLSNWRLNISAVADNRIYVRGMGLESEWKADLKIGGTAVEPSVVGEVEVIRGEYSFAGKRFNLARGIIRLTGAYPPDPTLDIRAETSVEGLTAAIGIGGTATQPQISFSSTPALPQDEILSRLLFGSSVTDLSAPEALQLAAAVASLRGGGGGGGGLNPVTALRKATGVDRLRILPGNEETGQGSSLAAGKYLGDDIYVEVATDARGNAATSVEFSLTRSLSILSSVAALGGQSVSLRWAKDY